MSAPGCILPLSFLGSSPRSVPSGMRTTITVRLAPTSAQARALTDTVTTYSDAANYISRLAWEKRVFRRVPLQKLAYGAVRENLGLSAQLTILATRRVADAYRTNRAALITFRTPRSATFDDRCLSWRFSESRVSISTVKGRIKDLQFRSAAHQVKMLQAHRKGETDLSFRDGKWFLHATCDIPEPPTMRVADVIGVDLGIANIAATSDRELYAGKELSGRRRRYDSVRARLQSKETKSARRLLKRRRRKEARMARDTNHRISKRIVREAERTERGIAIEDEVVPDVVELEVAVPA